MTSPARIPRLVPMRERTLAVEADRIEEALAALDPEERALVELSLIRDVADEDIAGILGTDVDEVRIRRADALVLLAVDLGASSGDEVGALMHDMRTCPPCGGGMRAKRTTRRWGTWSRRPSPSRRAPGRRRCSPPRSAARRAALLAGLLVAAAVALVLALSGGGGDDSDQAGATSSRPGRPRPWRASARSWRRSPVGRVTATWRSGATGSSCRWPACRIRAAPGTWSGSTTPSPTRARSAAPEQVVLRAQGRAAGGAGQYRFLDVSLEPADGNRNHSGQSVLRVPLSELQ